MSCIRKHGEGNYFKVASVWSQAGVGTCIVLETISSNTNEEGNKKKNKATNRIVFDIGSTPNFMDAALASVVVISHCHIDHVGAIFSHARAHKILCGGSVPTYYVPVEAVSILEDAKEQMVKLDQLLRYGSTSAGCCSSDGKVKDYSSGLILEDDPLPMNIIGVEDGQEFYIPNKRSNEKDLRIFIQAFRVDHRECAALGYILGCSKVKSNYDGKRGRELLKIEFQNCSNDEIRELVMRGIEIKLPEVKEVSKHLDIVYTGDTNIYGLSSQTKPGNNPYLESIFSETRVVICELTFLEYKCSKQRELAFTRGHIHIRDLMEMLRTNSWNVGCGPDLLFVHTSNRHKPAERMIRLMLEGIKEGVVEYFHDEFETDDDCGSENFFQSVLKKCNVAIGSFVSGNDCNSKKTTMVDRKSKEDEIVSKLLRHRNEGGILKPNDCLCLFEIYNKL